jgi:hypothetical protein
MVLETKTAPCAVHASCLQGVISDAAVADHFTLACDEQN